MFNNKSPWFTRGSSHWIEGPAVELPKDVEPWYKGLTYAPLNRSDEGPAVELPSDD